MAKVQPVTASMIARALFLARPATWAEHSEAEDMSEAEAASNAQWGLDVNEIERVFREHLPGFSPNSFRRMCGYQR